MRLKHTTGLLTILLLAGGPATAEAPLPAFQDSASAEPVANAVLPGDQPAAPPVLPAPTMPAQSPAISPALSPMIDAAAPSTNNPFAPPERDGLAAAAGALRLPAAQDGSTAPSGQAQPVDERALRYYAALRQLDRVQAEIKRLKARNPNWQPPVDMFSPAKVSIDEQPLWDLFAKGEFAELKRQIASRQKQSPAWRPSDDLSAKLSMADAKAKLLNAGLYGRWNEVVATAAESRNLLVCENMDVLWTVGEALIRTAKLAEGFEVYRYAVATCTNEQERLATVQKALLLLSQKGQDALITLAVQASSFPAAYEAMRFDALRKRMGAVAAGKAGEEIRLEELQSFATYVDAQKNPDDAGLLGWYFYAAGNFEAAAAWFKAGTQLGSDPKLMEGTILSLRKLGNRGEAEETAYKNRLRSPDIGRFYIEIVSEQLAAAPDAKEDRKLGTVVGTDVSDIAEGADMAPRELSKADMTRFARFVLDQKSALGAQALGWYALKNGQLPTAGDWFEKSLGWEATEGGVVGAAVIAARNREMFKLRALKTAYQEQFPELKKFKTGLRSHPKVFRRKRVR